MTHRNNSSLARRERYTGDAELYVRKITYGQPDIGNAELRTPGLMFL